MKTSMQIKAEYWSLNSSRLQWNATDYQINLKYFGAKQGGRTRWNQKHSAAAKHRLKASTRPKQPAVAVNIDAVHFKDFHTVVMNIKAKQQP